MNDKQPIFLRDYKVPDFLIKETNLYFKILEDKIIVTSTLKITKNLEVAKDLILNGEDLKTISIKLNDELLEAKDFSIADNLLKIFAVPQDFILQTVVEIDPYNNTKLMGIYKSANCLCSQCEPQGFRRITWFIDRPDVMSLWQVSITANINQYSTILSNGNLSSDKIEEDLRTCTFIDICPKPSYLFAFVAGNFDVYSDKFFTKSQRSIDLNVFVEEGKKNQAVFALESLKRAMKWDEDTYNLEYELDIFSIVAVSDFNFGAMENKSLNIFNELYVLADPTIATDTDYFNIEAIVAHEYFHNFTGNRITCRDWFQLTLKEGLTVFRDQTFSADLHDNDMVRIGDVEALRNAQFPEDASPLSHPIRPLSYIEMNNFYTSTVYEKGSEVIRMIRTLIGETNFKKGIAVYFENFDGQAVTCENFIWSMEQASGISLLNFQKWYFQSGTPVLDVKANYDEAHKSFTLALTQTTLPTFDCYQKHPLVLPLKVALFKSNGEKIKLAPTFYSNYSPENTEEENIVILEKDSESFTFNNVEEKPILSINRGFSAPIILKFAQDDKDLIDLIKYDDDGFIRFESLQTYLKNHILQMVNKLNLNISLSNQEINHVIGVHEYILKNYKQNIQLTAALLKLPTLTSLESSFIKDFPIENLYQVIKLLETAIANNYESIFEDIYNNMKDDETEFSATMIGNRALKNIALYYLIRTNKEKHRDLLVNYYNSTKSMTKRIGALVAVRDFIMLPEREKLFNDFYNQYKDYPTVLIKWLVLQATSIDNKTLEKVKEIIKLDSFAYTNPNKVRSLIGGFANNLLSFHKEDGSGYNFLEESILLIDPINPSIAAGLTKAFAKINLHTAHRQQLMQKSINNILQKAEISKGLYEILEKINTKKGNYESK
ncbi:Aminopeptidase N [Candidatus Hepatincolaceae symbiont of Richtersius coronifer]